MLFNSIEFLGFFVAVVGLSLLVPGRGRWLLLLAASYFFYACWRLEHVALMAGVTLVSYGAGIGIERTRSRTARKALLAAALAALLSALAVWKYLGFLSETARGLLAALGLGSAVPVLEVVLPVGVSFYTFQAMSYAVDVYRGDRPAERHLGRFALYVSFFPQLVAGPIERSTKLLPQLYRPVSFDADRVASGLALVLLGFWKKLVVADRLAAYVDEVYRAPASHSGIQLLLGTYFFAFQIYCDFGGYSDIAVGAARVLGYDLTRNFDRPYASRSVSEFWRRWHVTLSTWFRDYLYVPLGGNRCSRPRWVLNVMIVFLLSGLWHGAAWTFVLWGALHGLYLVASVLTAGPRARLARLVRLDHLGPLAALARTAVVFNLVAFAWVFFRARTLGDAATVVRRLPDAFARLPAVSDLVLPGFDGWELAISAVAIGLLALVETAERRVATYGFLPTRPLVVRWSAYLATLATILVFGKLEVVEFVYFQF